MKTIALQSGSTGNSIYVESNGTALLFDAGISGKQAQLRLAAYGRDIRRIDAVIISHDHRDHVACAGIYQRKFGLPVYITGKTLETARARCPLGPVTDLRLFEAGDTLSFGRLTVETTPTPHDASDGIAFVITSGRKRLGILTDLGHLFDGIDAVVGSLDGVFIESNYEPDMLENGPYPPFLKKRIRGPGGHISNKEAADLLRTSGSRLTWACLSHLSEQNNSPEIALRTHRRIACPEYRLHTASRYKATEVFSL